MSDLLSDMVSIPRATVERLLAMVEESGFTRRSNFFVKEVVDILALSTPPASPDAGRVGRVQKALRNFDAHLFSEHSAILTANWFCIALDATLATPSAPEDKGEGVNELVAKIEAKQHGTIILAHEANGWRVCEYVSDGDNGHDIRSGEVFSFGAPDILAALRAAASNTEREG